MTESDHRGYICPNIKCLSWVGYDAYYCPHCGTKIPREDNREEEAYWASVRERGRLLYIARLEEEEARRKADAKWDLINFISLMWFWRAIFRMGRR